MDARSSTVEMLWESTDPREALTKRFGFRDASNAAEWIAEVLEQYWDLEVTHCVRLAISGHNVVAWIEQGSRRLVVKWSALPRRFTHLKGAARLVAWLDANGIPVAAPIPTSDGSLLVELSNGRRGNTAIPATTAGQPIPHWRAPGGLRRASLGREPQTG